MGLVDLPAPLFTAIDDVLATFAPVFLRLLLWGILAGWLTMLLYRRLSNQARISEVKKQQKEQQKIMMDFEGEFDELMPLIFSTLGLGFRQLRLALGPALLASLPILILVIWVAGQFSHHAPDPGELIRFTAQPALDESYRWHPEQQTDEATSSWLVAWPAENQTAQLEAGGESILSLPLEQHINVIHKRQWWNLLMANPIGYLPNDSAIEQIIIDLPIVEALSFGPSWIRGWMFGFFLSFFISSIAFKFILKIE
jgi:uncharacterized membrane protein (DUF106 family)